MSDLFAISAQMGDQLADQLAEAATRARALGVDRLELRYQADTAASLRATDGAVDRDEQTSEAGIAVRAVVRGVAGHGERSLSAAGDPARHDAAKIAEAIDGAIAAACAMAKARPAIDRRVYDETEEEPARGHYETPCKEDPWEVEASERVALLTEATRRLRAAAGDEARVAVAQVGFSRSERAFAAPDGGRCTQRLINTGGALSLIVERGGEREARSLPIRTDGDRRAGGYEIIRALALVDHAERLAEEALALVRAPLCSAETTSVILSPEQLCFQIHESVGSALDGDRVLGEHPSPAGTSFVTRDALGRMRFGSTAVNLVADATLPGTVGSFGWDDEGVAARRTPLVQRGQLVGLLTTRRIAARLGLPRSGGCMRAASYRDEPRLRMTNLLLEPDPRGPSLEEMIADTAHGVLLGPNRSSSTDDRGLAFVLGCELAWEIRAGKRTRLLRRPVYRGRTPSFWRACDLVGGPADARVLGLMSRNRGEPRQPIAVGLSAPPARFRDVEIGASPA